MAWHTYTKIRFWRGQPVNEPLVTPPLSLRAMLLICVVSLTGTLVFAVANQLTYGTPSTSFSEVGFVVICYFLLPVLIMHTISTNWPISRVLIIAYAAAVAFQGLGLIEDSPSRASYRGPAIAAIFLSFFGIAWWLFVSQKLRIYYSLISGDGIPDDIEGSPEDLLSASRFESSFGRLADAVGPYFEAAVVVIVLVALLFAL